MKTLLAIVATAGILINSAQIAPGAPAPPARPFPGRAPARSPQRGPTTQNMSWEQWVELFKDYISLIDEFADVAKDQSSSGVAAVVYAEDVLKAKKPQDAIDWFNQILPEVKDPVVQRAVRLRLAELYRTTNQPDKALEQLRVLMTVPPPTTSPAAH